MFDLFQRLRHLCTLICIMMYTTHTQYKHYCLIYFICQLMLLQLYVCIYVHAVTSSMCDRFQTRQQMRVTEFVKLVLIHGRDAAAL